MNLKKKKKSKRALADMIIFDEIPFRHVEGKRFRHSNRSNQPSFNIPSTGKITKKCLTLYKKRKSNFVMLLEKT